jgi:hypothetical protein
VTAASVGFVMTGSGGEALLEQAITASPSRLTSAAMRFMVGRRSGCGRKSLLQHGVEDKQARL